MAQHHGEQTLGVIAVQGVDVSVAQSVTDNLADMFDAQLLMTLLLTFTLTSPALGGAIWMSVMSRGFFASQATAALQVMVWPLVALRESRNAVDIFLTEDRDSELNIIKYLKFNKLQLMYREVSHALH